MDERRIIFLVGVFNTKVVHSKTEDDGTSIVLPETGVGRYRVAPKTGKDCNKLIAGQFACLRKALHGNPDLDIATVSVAE
jgi:hypothetical protein